MRNSSKRIILALLLFAGTGLASQGKDTYFRGFYHGQNVFVRNPYLGSENGFCIQQVYLNGELVRENPQVSAFEIKLDALELESRLVIRIVHKDSCEPELTNPAVIEGDLKFGWLRVYVNEEQIIWVTTKEKEDGFYVVEKELGGIWEPVDTVKTKGGIFINQHSMEIDHVQGDNTYRVIYYEAGQEPELSEQFNYHSDKREISHAIDEENWTIEFTEEVSFLLYNSNSRVIRRGKDVTCNIQSLPPGTYIIKYDEKEFAFEKK